MAYWIAFLTDKPDAHALRLRTRPDHLEYMKVLKTKKTEPRVVFAFPCGEERMNGSCIMFCAETKAEVEAICDNDPYHKAGVFASRDIRKAFGDSFRLQNVTEPPESDSDNT